MAVNDIFKARVLCVCGNQISLNILHYAVTAQAGTGATDAQIASAIALAIANEYKALLNNNATFRGVGVQFINPGPARPEVADITQLGLGTAGATAMPTQACGLITLLSVFAGRHGRGRAFIPFPTTVDDVSPGQPVAGYNTRLQALANKLLAAVNAGAAGNTSTLALVVYNRLTRVGTFLTGFKTSPFWKTQRRRAQGSKGDLAPF